MRLPRLRLRLRLRLMLILLALVATGLGGWRLWKRREYCLGMARSLDRSITMLDEAARRTERNAGISRRTAAIMRSQAERNPARSPEAVETDRQWAVFYDDEGGAREQFVR